MIGYAKMLAAAAATLVLAGPVVAAQDGETWQVELAKQLEAEEGCVVAFLSQVVERNIDGRQVVLAKAHCEDDRAYDAMRDDRGQPFRLSPCGVPEDVAC